MWSSDHTHDMACVCPHSHLLYSHGYTHTHTHTRDENQCLRIKDSKALIYFRANEENTIAGKLMEGNLQMTFKIIQHRFK